MPSLLTVLILASSYASSQQLAAVMRARGWLISFVSQADAAVSSARRSRPNFIVIDSQLQGGALEALQALRAHADTAAIPALIMDVPQGETSAAFLAAGAQCCTEPDLAAEHVVQAVEQLGTKPLTVAAAPKAIIEDPRRLQALESTGLLGSSAEHCFDVLTALAAKLVGAPVTLITLVGKDRQYFKSEFGMGEPLKTERQTPIAQSFCQWVVSSHDDLIVEDASSHPVLSHNPGHCDMGVMAYAGIPLEAGANQTIGSFCAVDFHTRTWTPAELLRLRELASIVNTFILLRLLERAEAGADDSANVITPAHIIAAVNAAIGAATSLLANARSQLDTSDCSHLDHLIAQWSGDLRAFSAVAD